jgi:signal peptidase II
VRLANKLTPPIVLPLLVVILIVFADQGSKFILKRWGLRPVLNLGIAFGLLPSSGWVIGSLVIIGGMVALLINDIDQLGLILRLGFGLVIGGGLANLIDRLWLGSVRDFFFIGFLPAFNLADLAIGIGAMLLIVQRWGKNSGET